MRGDRRCLRDDRQVVAAEHLVAAAGDRLARRGDHPGEDVAHTVETGATEVEAAAAIVQQGRVGGPRRPSPGWRCSRARQSRSCSSPCPASATTAPRGRNAGWPAAGRRARRDRAGVAGGRCAWLQGLQQVDQLALERRRGWSLCGRARPMASGHRSRILGGAVPLQEPLASIHAVGKCPRPGTFPTCVRSSPCSPPGGRDRRRSGDPTLFRRVLCRLSYPTVLDCLARTARFALMRLGNVPLLASEWLVATRTLARLFRALHYFKLVV